MWMSFISFPSLTVVAGTSCTMLNTSVESPHPCLAPDLRGKASRFCPLSMMLAVRFSCMAFMLFHCAPSTTTLLSVFSQKWVMYSNKCFFSLCWYDRVSFVFPFVYVIYVTFIDLQILYHPCIPGMNPTWSCCVIFLLYFWLWLANILFRILASVFISNIGQWFSFFVVSIFGLGIRLMLAS